MDIEIRTENLLSGCVTDVKQPRFSFKIISEKQNVELENAEISVGEWKVKIADQILIPYGGQPLTPFTEYTVKVSALNNHGEKARADSSFSTGRMGTPWQAKWITDASLKSSAKHLSSAPMVFRKRFKTQKEIAKAAIYCTATGIFAVSLNGNRVGEDYFACGLTYRTYDITKQLSADNELLITVVLGQALLAELRITYADGTEEIIGTDENWDVCEGGYYRAADSRAETYDSTVNLETSNWRKAKTDKQKYPSEITAASQSLRAKEAVRPVSCVKHGNGQLIYDFGQNFAGVIIAKIKGKAGQKIIFRHAEDLNGDGVPNPVKFTATYICGKGAQEYSPKFAYTCFRFVGVEGVEKKNLELSAVALSTDAAILGSFECSNKRVNKIYSDAVAGAKPDGTDISAIWEKYFTYGDIRLLELSYESLKDSVKEQMPKKSIFGKRRGGHDGVLASYCVMEKIAALLGKEKDAAFYKALRSKEAEEVVAGLGGILKNELQFGYALALYCGAFPEGRSKKAADNLKKLVEMGGYEASASPYILFALADNGQQAAALDILTGSERPCISETVVDFLYKRVAGIVPLEAGYKKFMIKPLIGGGLTFVKCAVETPYGKVVSEWKTQGSRFSVKIRVPACAECDVYLPNGESIGVGSGEYEFTARLN